MFSLLSELFPENWILGLDDAWECGRSQLPANSSSAVLSLKELASPGQAPSCPGVPTPPPPRGSAHRPSRWNRGAWPPRWFLHLPLNHRCHRGTSLPSLIAHKWLLLEPMAERGAAPLEDAEAAGWHAPLEGGAEARRGPTGLGAETAPGRPLAGPCAARPPSDGPRRRGSWHWC